MLEATAVDWGAVFRVGPPPTRVMDVSAWSCLVWLVGKLSPLQEVTTAAHSTRAAAGLHPSPPIMPALRAASV